MYAVILTGGKQYRVAEGEVFRVEKLPVATGGQVRFEQVLMIGGSGTPQIGRPYLDGAAVTADVVAQDRDAKIVVFKKKRRKGYQKRQGHRQAYTEVKIVKIEAA